MNRIYSRVWNETTGAWVVASELACRRTGPRATGRRGTANATAGSAAAAARPGGLLAAGVLAAGMLAPTMAWAISAQTSADFQPAIDLGDAQPGAAATSVTVEEAATSGRYANGIRGTSNDSAITVVADRVLVTGEGSDGIVLLSYSGDLTVEAGSVATRYDGPFPEDQPLYGMLANVSGAGIFASSVMGNVRVGASDVETASVAGYGIGAQTGYSDATSLGRVAVDSGRVLTRGDYGIGIFARGGGDVTVLSDSVVTQGYNAHAVYAVSLNRSVDVASGHAEASGDTAYGILARAPLDISVQSDSVVTRGGSEQQNDGSMLGAYGIFADGGQGTTRIVSGRVETAGSHATGIRVRGGRVVEVDSTRVDTAGDFAVGIDVAQIEPDGSLRIDSGEVTTSGRFAEGIAVVAGDADTQLDSASVTVSGEGSHGIVVLAHAGDITIDSGRVQSLYDGGFPADNDAFGRLASIAGAGVWGSSIFGNVAVRSGEVETHGLAAYGVGAQVGFGSSGSTASVTLDSGRVSTQGDYAIGLFATTTGSGTVTVSSDEVSTQGLNSHGIYAISAGGAVSVDSGTISVAGANATGILARGQGVSVRSGSIVVQGEPHDYGGGPVPAYGISAQGGQGAVAIDSGTVATSGVMSTAIRVNGASSVDITSGSVDTQGQDAVGIMVDASGAVDLASATVTTRGAHAHGIVVHTDGDIAVQAGRTQASGEGASGLWVHAGGRRCRHRQWRDRGRSARHPCLECVWRCRHLGQRRRVVDPRPGHPRPVRCRPRHPRRGRWPTGVRRQRCLAVLRARQHHQHPGRDLRQPGPCDRGGRRRGHDQQPEQHHHRLDPADRRRRRVQQHRHLDRHRHQRLRRWQRRAAQQRSVRGAGHRRDLAVEPDHVRQRRHRQPGQRPDRRPPVHARHGLCRQCRQCAGGGCRFRQRCQRFAGRGRRPGQHADRGQQYRVRARLQPRRHLDHRVGAGADRQRVHARPRCDR
jgi:hypothetical protein